jgi:hypothetical protein
MWDKSIFYHLKKKMKKKKKKKRKKDKKKVQLSRNKKFIHYCHPINMRGPELQCG